MATKNTSALLIATAEELYGRHGLDAVSLRQIAEAAGQRNPAVVQYHFATKQGLLRAIVEYRTPGPNRRRNEMLDELRVAGRAHDVHALVACAVYPLVEQLPGYAAFLRFADRAHADQELVDIIWNLDEAHASSGRRLTRALLDAMGDVPLAIKVHRIRLAFQLLLRAVADHVTKVEDGVEGLLPNEVFYADVINAASAFLLAPVPAIATTLEAEAAAAEAPLVTLT